MSASTQRACWCGHSELQPYSEDYYVCKACGTLVSRAPVRTEAAAPALPGQFYSEDYWLQRQREHHGLPDIHARARLDLPERCAYWLQHLLAVQLPPARVLEVGCGHGGYVALLNWAGFSALGTEMSPWVADFAKKTFGVDVLAGPLESQSFAPGSFDVIVFNDVIEHLSAPQATLAHAAKLLKPGGFFVIQTPEYKEHLTYADLVATNDLFLKHMDRNNEEHLYLFSRRSAGLLFSRLGFPAIEFLNPIFSYDFFFTANRAPMAKNTPEQISAGLSVAPSGRLVQALLDKAYESTDRGWAMQRLQAQLTQNKNTDQH